MVPIKQYELGFTVAGGISWNGLTRLNFCVGTMNSFSYEQALRNFSQDLHERLGEDIYFQQDNAPCHTSKESMKLIEELFPRRLDFWPPHSPDLSPIENVWSILETMLARHQFSTLEEKKEKLLEYWNSFPLELCRKLINEFDKRIKWVGDHLGEIY